jgi:hypothetical protein
VRAVEWCELHRAVERVVECVYDAATTGGAARDSAAAPPTEKRPGLIAMLLVVLSVL